MCFGRRKAEKLHSFCKNGTYKIHSSSKKRLGIRNNKAEKNDRKTIFSLLSTPYNTLQANNKRKMSSHTQMSDYVRFWHMQYGLIGSVL